MANSTESAPLQSSSTVKVRSHYRPHTATESDRGRPRLKRTFPPLGKGLVWGSLVTLTATIAAIAGVGVGFFTPGPRGLVQQVIPGQSTGVEASQGDLFPYHISRPVNILVMGIDRVEPTETEPDVDEFGGRSDTMLLVRFDPRENSLKLLSIPRDTRVFIPDVGYTKINDANAYGGPQLAAGVINRNLGEVPIDRYVRVTTDALQELVDLVGGVEVFVPRPMFYEDKTQQLLIDLPAGLQTLNGQQAEQFVRFRYDANGDIGRVQRQETLLKALQNRLSHPSMITRIPKAITIVQKTVDTNLTMEEILALVNFGRQLDRQEVQMVMLPGRFSQPTEFDGRSYWVMSDAGKRQVLRNYFNVIEEVPSWAETPGRSPESLRIALQNATDDPQALEQVKEYLRGKDFRNFYETSESPELLAETKILVQRGDLDGAHYLRQTLGGGVVEASSVGDLGSDLTIQVGMDIDQWLKETTPMDDSAPQF
ncbi:LCP family protein [Synechocystis sp. PCC 7338]|uniref:LCP family protein n=1 Tax=Synechocystis sp. PCC 7338 TaxID=2732530 RepID=UPI001BAFFFD8|nr:LCP family protein [Synechocystis sp. PCC 7338]QUS61848.1 LCP family protein [Synechocystis sp. PCC 7338]